MIISVIYTIKEKMGILQERVLKCVFSFTKHNIKVEASCSGLGLAFFKFKKGQQVQEKGHSNRERKARTARGTWGTVKINYLTGCQH